MSDDRIPNILIYCRVHDKKRNVQRSYLRYRNALTLNIPVDTFGQFASISKDWGENCHKDVEIH